MKPLTNAEQKMAKLPEYHCHKTVWALKIRSIALQVRFAKPASSGAIVITPEDDNYAPFEVSLEYMEKHDPKVGGYWVMYEDGYQSWSPAAAFEGGYTRV